MFYSNITIKGFGSYYAKKSINLTNGLNVITGNNGSGKTTIIDAIQWNIFGPRGSDRTLIDRTSIINNRSQSAHVELTFYNEMGEEIISRRSLSRAGKHSLSVFIDGEEVSGGLSKSQEVLDDSIFNIDNQSFTAVSIMHSSPSLSVNRFITGNSDTKREILSTLVDPLKVWESSHKVIEKKLKDERKILKDRENKYTLSLGLLDNLREIKKPTGDVDDWKTELASLLEKKNEDKSSNNSESYKLKLSVLENKLQKLTEKNESLYVSINDKNTSIVKYKKKIDNAEIQLDKNKDSNIDFEIDSIDYSIKNLKKEVSELEEQKKRLENIVSEGKVLQDIFQKSKTRCLVCGSDTSDISIKYNHNDHHNLYEIQEILSSIDDKIKNLSKKEIYLEKYKNIIVDSVDNTSWEDEIEHYKNLLDDVTSSKKSLSEEMDNIKKEKIDIEKQISNMKIKISSNSNNDPQDDSIDEKINILDNKIRDFNFMMKKYNDYIQEKKDLTERKESDYIEWKNQENVVDILLTLREKSSVKGIISEDIDNISQEITDESNDIYSNVFHKNANIEINTEYNKKDEPLTIVKSQGRDIGTFSHGEQNRMIMSILIGITKVMKNRYGIWLTPMWDEPTAMIDSDFNGSAFDIITYYDKEEENQSIVIIRDYDIIEKSQDIISNTIKL